MKHVTVKDRLFFTAAGFLVAFIATQFAINHQPGVGSKAEVRFDPFVADAKAQEKDKPKAEEEKTYATGYKLPENYEEIRARTVKRTGYLTFPKATAAKWDCRELGIVGPVKNQGNCGSCWDFAGTGIVESGMIKAGYGKPDGSFQMSEQYILDCDSTHGGCNGDDHSTVLNHAKKTGMPTTKDYGPYKARRERCHSDGLKLYKISDWGYCDPNKRGVAATQAIKDAMVQYGPISVAIAANNAFMNIRPGSVFEGNAGGINHEVILVGWDDTKGSKGAWILKNSWGTDWAGDGSPNGGGYCWIGYGANSVGTEAVWCSVAPLPPPPEAPKITSAIEVRGFPGQPLQYQITASGSPTSYSAAGLPAGMTVSLATGLISGTPQGTAVTRVSVGATNAAGTGTAVVTFAIGTVPPPDPGPGPNPDPSEVTLELSSDQVLTALQTKKVTLTNAQVQQVIDQSGLHVVSGDMTLRDLISVLDRAAKTKAKARVPSQPCCDGAKDDKINAQQSQIDALKKGLIEIMDRLDSKKKESSKP